MQQPWHEDPTRRHACVTAGLVAAAALVLVVLDDPAMRMAPGRAGAGASTATAAGGGAAPLADQAPYRQFDVLARPVRAQPGERGPVIRPAVMGSTTPMLPRKK